MIPILFQNAYFVVLNKPAGLAVHPGPGGGPSVEDVFPALSRRKEGPWLVHRLDADTAGCLVVALRKRALLAAQAAFVAGTVRKTYWAVVHGVPGSGGGEIANNLQKRNAATGWRMEIAAAGLPARTTWRLMGQAGGLAWLELEPSTGRTHQIRVHCAGLGHPIVGDPVYGRGDGSMQLLSRAVMLPVEPRVCAVAPPPGHMREALLACGWDGDAASARAANQTEASV